MKNITTSVVDTTTTQTANVPSVQKAYYRADETAYYMGICESMVWKLRAQGHLTAIKLSAKCTVFAKSQIDAFIASKICA